MPPCPISSPPPALALALPWETPSDYAAVLLFVVVFAAAVSYVYAKAAKPVTGRTRIAFILVVTGSMIAVAGVAVYALVLGPYVDHIGAWDVAQIRRFGEQPCSLGVQFAREQGLITGAFTWEKFIVIFSLCGLAVYVIGLQLIRPAMRGPAAEMSGT